MEKIYLLHISVFLGLLSLTLTSSYANQEADDMNSSAHPVKTMKTYPGMWKGWSDGCVNCGKPLASDRVRSKSKKKIKKQSKSKGEKALPKSVRGGYCECNCKTQPSDLGKSTVKDSSTLKTGVKRIETSARGVIDRSSVVTDKAMIKDKTNDTSNKGGVNNEKGKSTQQKKSEFKQKASTEEAAQKLKAKQNLLQVEDRK